MVVGGDSMCGLDFVFVWVLTHRDNTLYVSIMGIILLNYNIQRNEITCSMFTSTNLVNFQI